MFGGAVEIQTNKWEKLLKEQPAYRLCSPQICCLWWSGKNKASAKAKPQEVSFAVRHKPQSKFAT